MTTLLILQNKSEALSMNLCYGPVLRWNRLTKKLSYDLIILFVLQLLKNPITPH